MELLRTLARKARGILGLGIVAGSLGIVGGALGGVVDAILTVGVFPDAGYWQYLLDRAFRGALYWGQPAAFIGLGVGTVLGVAGRRLTLAELRWPWMALVGAIVGALFIPTYLVTTFGLSVILDFPWSLLPISAGLSMTGAALSAGLTIVAQRAERRELRVVEDVAALAADSGGDEAPSAAS